MVMPDGLFAADIPVRAVGPGWELDARGTTDGLLRLRGNRLQPCVPVQRRLQEKLADVQRKLRDLHKLEHELRLALRSCNRELRKRDAHCPILREKTLAEASK